MKLKRGDTRGISMRTIERILIDEDGMLRIPPLGYRDYYSKTDFVFFT